MRSNSKQVRTNVKNYILETVHDFNENEFPTFEAAANHLVNEFIRVAGHKWNVQRYPNHQERFGDYLDGGPFWFPVYNHEFIEVVNSWGINPEGKEYPMDKTKQIFHSLLWKEVNEIYYKVKEAKKEKI